MSPDRLSEVAPMHTPYRFAFNNPIFWKDPIGLFKQNFETCPTCPKTPEFKPYIDDPNNEYVYDPDTKTVSEVIQLQETTVINSNNTLEYFGLANGIIGGVSDDLGKRGGAFAIWNGSTGRSFDGIKINELKFRYSKTNKGFNQYTGKGIKLANVNKIIQKGSIVTSVILETPKIADSFEKGNEEVARQIAGSTGSIGGGILGGMIAGAIIGSETGPGAILFALAGGAVGGVVGEETMKMYFDAAVTPDSAEQKQMNQQKVIQSTQIISGPLKY